MARYFDQIEARIIKRLHAEAMSDESREELLRSTGIDDPQLIDELSKLGITVDELIALRFFPLVMVAWAEDNADVEERHVVQAQAGKLGIREDSTAWIVLDTWLRTPPPGIGVDAWKRYTHSVFSKMSTVACERLIELTRDQMTQVAKASGGHFGIGKVSGKERTMIDRLVETMRGQMKSVQKKSGH
jgi:hypothetical protein